MAPERDKAEKTARPSLGGPRVLLRRLRETMAAPVSAQEKLDKVAVLIAANMVAEVCSVYVMQADDDLELFATEGLNREAVHLTKMKAGEGLVGLIAREAQPLALSDAHKHPAFSYRPETGEEIYNAFLGVPILRAGNTLGVLVVQNRAHRVYTEEEIEALQTTAMVLAEIVASGELQSIVEPGETIAIRRPISLAGEILSEGIGLGHAVLHEPRVVIRNFVADDPASEGARIDQALEAVQANIDELVERGGKAGQGEHVEILEALRMVANDKGWLRRLHEAIATGLTAEAAVERVQNDTRARMMRSTDPYLRDRLHDLDDLASRLLHQLVGQGFVRPKEELPDNAILVARAMGPTALLEYDRARLRGLVLEEGGASSHVAVIARALGLPAVSGITNIVGLVEPGDALIVDGVSGDVRVRPQPDVEAAYAERARMRARRQEQYRRLRDVPAVTKDGAVVSLLLNAGLRIDLPHLDDTGADGIGLLRTELQYMVSPRLPSLSQQEKLYRMTVEAAGARPVTFRTLDIGGDKVLPYFRHGEEENPALGWRAIRIGLDRPALLRVQLRAMLRACAGREARIMTPMIAAISEFERARGMVEQEIAFLRKHGHELPARVQFGVMIEVPSLLHQIDEIAASADFLSVGSNDLLQYLFAADRENPRVAQRFDSMSPPFLRVLQTIVEAGARARKPVSICGEIGGKPLEAMALIALGYRQLSMSPASIGPVKAMILSLNVKALRTRLAVWMKERARKDSLREELSAFARETGVQL
ncbi:MAG: phosphoenolpyruvate--protein phosphotransferase [Rhizobiales bacterium 65-9]|nr:phosphoenolpyruvate--protein phosphotransferase [Hyphomicrobiales bacterium]OJY32860.1 MAG: phosphoenolpyruvate--protein phosphotransferase [Rhizobiales bacterium 65-9]